MVNEARDDSGMRAIAYVRVSSEEQVHGTSLDSQEKACVEYAARQGLTLDPKDIFREEGVSAKILDRPQLAALLSYCARNKGSIHQCIVWKVDRLARKSEYHHIIKAKLAKYGVKLVSVTEPISDDPTGTLMEGILAAFAQFDNEIRTQRTSAGMKARTYQGGWPHDAPYGYTKGRTPSGVTYLVPDEETAPIMTKLLAKFETGDFTIKQIADLAYELGVRNKKGGKRDWQAIKNMIVNPIYAGYVQSKFTDGEKIKGLHKPLISESAHYRILAIINGDVKKYSKHAELEWPLRGGFLRHTCGTAATGSAPRGRNGPSPRYHCMGACRATKDTRVSKRREEVHDDFLALMQRIRPDEPTQKLFKEVVLRRWNNEFKEAITHNARLSQEIEACNDKKSRIIDLFIDGKLTAAEKDMKLAEVDASMAQLKIQSIEADKYVTQKEQIIDGALLFMSDPGLFWNQSDINVKKRVQDVIFPEGVEYDFDTGFGTVKLAESYQLMQELSENNLAFQFLAPGTGFEPAT
ncbi:MAG: recombinase family protein [Candidatus Saccharimonadales bacterium]